MNFQKGNKINSGGFGIVYEAFRSNEPQAVALKELANADVSGEDAQRFVREVKMQAKLKHKNIVPILEFDLSARPPWFTMPLARTNLRSELPRFKNNARMLLNAFYQILDGVAHAHKNGVIHRDLKPENILIFGKFYEMDVKVGDFGLGKRLSFETVTVTSSADNMGTVAYMPPEQFKNFKHVDERADIYSLGKILYEMVTGEFPLYVDLGHPLIRSTEFEYALSFCLKQSPAERFNSIADLRSALMDYVPPRKTDLS